MTTAIGITLLLGFGAGLVFGVPIGRTWERLWPDKQALEADEKKRR